MRCLSLALVAVVLLAARAAAAPMKIDPNQNWVAVVRDEALKAVAPKDGLITDAKTFAKVWKAWRKDDKLPEIDFNALFVVVTLAGGPNRPGVSATLDEGDLKILARQTLIGGQGFGYSLATFPRKGIKTVKGMKLP